MATDSNRYHAIGIMSGTSADGADAVLIREDGTGISILDRSANAFPAGLKAHIHRIQQSAHIQLDDLGHLHSQLGAFYAALAQSLIAKYSDTAINVIGVHGQTLRHRPNDHNAFSLQTGNYAIVATTTGIPTVGDFRSADIALGGQGAPLVPAFHQQLFQAQTPCAIINIGGIANSTQLQLNQPVSGFDTGPGNTLLDYWTQKHFNQPYDDQGALAAQGTIDAALLASMLTEPYFQQPAPKSTGFELFNSDWLSQHLPDQRLHQPDNVDKYNILATLTELTAYTIADNLNNLGVDSAYIAGGGVYNHTLLHALTRHTSISVKSCQTLNIDPLSIEAAAFAWMAIKTLNHQPSINHEVTGAKRSSIAGAIYYP